jgi:hypothetical protein
MENDGYANLLSPNLSEIGGAERHSQWVFYSRMWNDEEKVYVDEKIIQIQKEHLHAPGQFPFVKLKQILRYLPVKCTKVGSDDIPDGESSKSDVEMVAGDVAVVPKDIHVALTKAIVVPKVPSKAPGQNKSLALTNQEVVPPKEDMLKAEKKG